MSRETDAEAVINLGLDQISRTRYPTVVFGEAHISNLRIHLYVSKNICHP